MKAKIIRISQEDAYYIDNKKMKGKIIDCSNMKKWGVKDNRSEDVLGLWYGKTDVNNDSVLFFAVKLKILK